VNVDNNSKYWHILVALFCTVVAQAGSYAELSKQLDMLLLAQDPELHLGLEIRPLNDTVSCYKYQNAHVFTPASTTKLFTAAAAFSILGPLYTFETYLFTDGAIKDSVLEGDLYLKGTGDPSLTYQDLCSLVEQLEHKNIREIKGNFYVDSSFFDDISYGPGWLNDCGSAYWHAPVSALNAEHNSVTLTIKASGKPSAVAVNVEPKTSYVRIHNKALIDLKNNKQNPLEVVRRWRKLSNDIDITGTLPIDSTQTFVVTIEHPELYAGALFKQALANVGISVDSVRIKKAPANATVVACHASKPLKELISFMLKESDNLYAECIFKTLGAQCYGAPGTWQNGEQAVKNFLTTMVNLADNQVSLKDGSGLSYYNLVSPESVITLLCWIYHKASFAAVFQQGLAIWGIDGTLKNRLCEDAQGKICGKTGSLRGVSALAGYVLDEEKEPLVFSFMLNGALKNTAEYKTGIEDQLGQILIKNLRPSAKPKSVGH
jgi:D-alanyl-D-alanine carboxypeptidase/D-alanyl-D-alanine-endopeptidase (penicillin-binding protein 4)